jgi:hypothetical protein
MGEIGRIDKRRDRTRAFDLKPVIKHPYEYRDVLHAVSVRAMGTRVYNCLVLG